jgi:hypothetical protein
MRPVNQTFSQGLQTSIARLDETTKILENIRKAYESYERYAEEGKGTQQQLAAYYDLTTKKVEALTAAMNANAVAAENARRTQANVAQGPTSQTVGLAGGASAYAAQFEAAAKAQEEQVASINKLRAAMNPLEEAQGRIAQQMIVYRTALEGKISQKNMPLPVR